MVEKQEKNVLKTIKSPDDLKKLSINEKTQLACEIRKELIEVISQNGGHLAPNLGVVELTIAIHSVFNAPKDKIIWDVGHQAYVHKLLTARQELFKTLRKDDGCIGFLSRDESEYDVFGAGHAGTAISAALGIAVARDLDDGKEKVIAVVGDGSLNCGISLEGLNIVAEQTKDMVIIINDNKMSISQNVGSMAKYLNRLISAQSYNKFKAFVKKIVRSIPMIGDDITKKISKLEEAAKSILVPGVIFEELGLRYIGPINGHDIAELSRAFELIKEFKSPVVLHVITEKGGGYKPAESAPEKFHGLTGFDPDTGNSKSKSNIPTFSQGFGNAICALAKQNENVLAITAAMKAGTGLGTFAEKFPKQFFDVGIAEEHAVVFAAGLASSGKRPVIALYASFLQRALDYVMHDVCLQNLPVIFCVDRAGIVDDGPTHHGIYDMAFLKVLPNISILSPKDECELHNMLFAAYKMESPVVIRYPRGPGSGLTLIEEDIPWGKAEILRKGDDLALWTIGKEVSRGIEICDLLQKQNINATLVNARFLKPFDAELLIELAEKMPIVSLEDAQIMGGIGGTIDSVLINQKHSQILHLGWDDDIIPHGTILGIRKKFDLNIDAIVEKIKKDL